MKKYTTPDMELVLFAASDVITYSIIESQNGEGFEYGTIIGGDFWN